MEPRGRGTIVQVGSGLAYRSIPFQAPYCAAKAAARAFTDSVRTELIHDGSEVRLSVVNLPAVNTPQFTWVRSRLPRAAQPLPPVYQPELAARAIVWAAEHRPRELDVGWPTILGRIGQGLVPGLMDRYLARAAWTGQQSDDPEPPGRPDNVDQTVRVDVGAHGTFDVDASDRSPLLWVTMHGRAILAGAAAVSLAGVAAIVRRGSARAR
jgi:hypothetical protein